MSDIPGYTAKITVDLTGDKGKAFPFKVDGWPQEQNATEAKPAVFRIPADVTDGVLEFAVKDVRQTLNYVKNAGVAPFDAGAIGPGEAVSDLSIEAIHYNGGTGQYELYNIFGVMAQITGYEAEIAIPDLMADVNGDRSLDGRDVLYSLVDLMTYLPARPAVAIGATYEISGGRVAGLPGMLFSITPFEFDPAVGFSFTPFSGLAEAEGIHLAKPIPEPSSLATMMEGLAALCLAGIIGKGCRRTR